MPPSAFDVLGVLSFVQGSVTAVAAGILAFQAATVQVRDNQTTAKQLTSRLLNLVDRFDEPFQSLSVSASDEGRITARTKRAFDQIQVLLRRPLYSRWTTGDEDAKTIADLSVQVARLELEVTEVSITAKMSAAVDRAIDAVGQALLENHGQVDEAIRRAVLEVKTRSDDQTLHQQPMGRRRTHPKLRRSRSLPSES
ncbi:hypothetical protein C8F04DRAFT_1407133 [Mycena alexandri]|uniref:Uncharacterized protein n=1 Tax=Mycena alexandri TaxID=1745969 RepID=A0AAD6WPR4_9AGAR|nr:hypothetical protein C8F04DRAFT_1407133 [Mycena alexandri]